MNLVTGVPTFTCNVFVELLAFQNKTKIVYACDQACDPVIHVKEFVIIVF